MVIKETSNNIQIYGLEDFDLKHIFDCGQCFRFRQTGINEYTGTAHGHVLTVSHENDVITFKNTDMSVFNSVWYDYFDFGKDYKQIKNHLSGDECMNRAIDEGYGIRILRQDLFETIISFIISQSNNIPRIKKIIETLCINFGEKLEYNGENYYTFPTPDAIADSDISILHAGYRDKYITDAAKTVLHNPGILKELKEADTLTAKKILMSMNGIGNKVSDCILLFGLGKTDSFPVDVWMKRIMEQLYFKKQCSVPEISAYASERFGEYSGYAQQYLFFYALNHKNELNG